MAPPLLETHQIAKSFGPVVALQSVDLIVQPGEVHALLGANGAGKSTMVKILSGVFGPDQGTVSIHGSVVRARKPTDAMAAGIATVFQDPALVPDLTLGQNFRLTDANVSAIDSWLERFELEDLDKATLVREIPLETLRLIDLARALSIEPQILLLDEITAALPADKAEFVFDVMRHQRDQGVSILFITHRLAEVLAMCDRATILREGRDVTSMNPGDGDESVLVEAMLGSSPPPRLRESNDDDSSTGEETSETPIVLQAVDLNLGDQVRNVNLELRAGEILGVAALEGQGQEQLFDLFAGARRPTSGEVRVNGKQLSARSPYDAISQGVVLVPADRLHALLPNRSVRENLAAPLYNRISRWFGLQSDESTRVQSAIDRLSIDTRAEGKVRQLSGGNQQKVVIGKWLATGFKTLLLFDPTRGIDIQTKRQVYELLRELAGEGAAVLLYTSELAEIPQVCDRVVVMYDGAIVDEQDGPTSTESSMLAAAHGLAATGNLATSESLAIHDDQGRKAGAS